MNQVDSLIARGLLGPMPSIKKKSPTMNPVDDMIARGALPPLPPTGLLMDEKPAVKASGGKNGLLDFFGFGEDKAPDAKSESPGLPAYNPEEESRRAGLAAVAAVLKNSGPTRLPSGFGEGLGAGLEAGQKAASDYRSDAARNAYNSDRLASGGNTPAAMQMANEVARLEAAGDFAGAQRIREFAKTASVQNEYRGLAKDANGNFINPSGYVDAASNIKRGEKRGEKMGEGDAAFEQNYSTQTAKNNYAIQLIDSMVGAPDGTAKEHPGLRGAVGLSSVIPNRPGSDAKDFENRLAQINGQQFLQAFESLKGGGQITEVEGTKATNAIARMQASNSEGEFIAAAREFQKIIGDAQARANQRAGAAPQGGAPAGGGMRPAAPMGNKAKFLGFE